MTPLQKTFPSACILFFKNVYKNLIQQTFIEEATSRHDDDGNSDREPQNICARVEHERGTSIRMNGYRSRWGDGGRTWRNKKNIKRNINIYFNLFSTPATKEENC